MNVIKLIGACFISALIAWPPPTYELIEEETVYNEYGMELYDGECFYANVEDYTDFYIIDCE